VTAGRTTERQVLEVGGHGFVEKPFGLCELDHAISQLV